jgi:UDP-N-acetylglucosamine 2-epimerase (non-hydrolysing)
MEEAAVMMVGLDTDRVLQGLKVLETQSRGEPAGSPARTLAPVADYHRPAVSEKVLRIILGYTDYVNRVVWRKA